MTVKVPQVGDRHVSRSTHESYEVLEVRADEGDVNPNPYLVRVSKSPGPGPRAVAVYLIGKRDSYVIVAQLSPEFTARLSLDAIQLERGWNPEDVEVVSAATPDQIDALLRASAGDVFRRRLKVLLRLGEASGGRAAAIAVSKATLDLLRAEADRDPINAVRFRQYLLK